MTRSMFDPTGNESPRGRGSRYLGNESADSSHLPSTVQPETAEEKSLDGVSEAQTEEEAVERLEEMQQMTPAEVDADLPDAAEVDTETIDEEEPPPQ